MERRFLSGVKISGKVPLATNPPKEMGPSGQINAQKIKRIDQVVVQ